MAEFLLIHSRIQAEREENSRVVCSLQMLGIIDKEMVKCLCYKNFLRFIPAIVVGINPFFPAILLSEGELWNGDEWNSGRNRIWSDFDSRNIRSDTQVF